ncbi:beta-ketoacyl-[acyl-carrier-protein] synthase family protein [Pseudoclavibacter sp. CFCC 14310]|uniref:beta-ketoacyl-[acyl-carrier-protein] synthase family protein n=1 Tax=Pseudoclavibacter sp. CFCC 14310 TaxID=2615180 RepID=UPI001300E40D|nr:beta-ketoacyl-[acyl-carrier-protein] synthase family protein [Pseudoclavibacter sp. CFCC 14310]KAB1646248.1 beta-ketoacyl-[acyl-carrier-protein] synthase family protein [Pseudoclavibacter sp. CFCC 14310]
MKKKIVVTGMGTTNPLGGDVASTWQALLNGESGVSTIDQPWVEKYDLPVRFAGQAKVRPAEVLTPVEVKRNDPSTQLAIVAAREAWQDAGAPEVDPTRLGVDFATGIGGVWTLFDSYDALRERGPRRVMPLTVPMLMANASAAAISLEFQAQAFARTVLSACASSVESIVNAYDHLQQGYADVVIAGGTESTIHPLPLAAFASMRALSKSNDDPQHASRPLDVNRNGFVMGEGAAVLVLESEEHALARGAHIYAEITGGAVTADSYHITSPDPEGLGAARAVRATLENSGETPESVGHINLHATSTPVGDPAEYKALHAVLGDALDSIPVAATKGNTGHLLGGTGALETVFTVKAVQDRVTPPLINLDQQDPETPFFAPTGAPHQLPDEGQLFAISNSFGFGGHNAVVGVRSV